MILRFFLYAVFLAALLVLPGAPRAQDQSDGTLHVLRPTINAEQGTAELCLEFDHALDLSDRRRVIAGIHLESAGKPVPVASSNVNLAATSLCLQSLAYRQEYSLTVTDLRGANNEKLNGPYKLPFTVPDRRPTLAFAGDPGANGLARYADNNPVLHAVNVARARIVLYRVADPARMAEAYRQRLQTTLAPSESLAFAKDNGQLVWQGELVLDDSASKGFANQSLERPVPLQAAAGPLPPGLYFIAAEDVAPPPKTKPAETGLTPLAAQWFIRSDLGIGALQEENGFLAMADKADASAAAKGIRLLVLDRDQQIMAEAESDADGLAFLPVAKDKRANAAVLIGLAKAGDVDFLDISADQGIEDRQSAFTLPDLDAALIPDRSFYRPGDSVNLMLTARSGYGVALATPGSLVQLLRSDQSLYATMPVPDGKAGVSWLSFPAPPGRDVWSARWQQADGRVLAQTPLRVTANKKAPRLEISADRGALDDSGDVVLSLKSVTDAGMPAPYIAGHIVVQWTTPDTLAGWSDYHFGDGEKTANAPAPVAAFITDANGTARLHLTLKPPADSAPLHTVIVGVRSDPAMGVFDPGPLPLPVKPARYIVGIKPLAPDGKFAENSFARFDVIAIDGDGKRRAASDLEYQIYEEGRSFAWFQTEGRWDYKPLQQRRRIGGGVIAVKADGNTSIRWPVTAGAYTLEITDANGVLLTRSHFDAGWGLLRPSQIRPTDLALVPAVSSIEAGIPVKIAFTLTRAAMITAVIADDHIRKVIHEARAAGANVIEFTPEEGWSNRIRIHVSAQITGDREASPLVGDVELPVRHNPKELTLSTEAPDRANPGQQLALGIAVGKIAGQPTFVSVLATPVQNENNINSASVSALTKGVETGANGRASVHLTAPPSSGDLHVKIVASNQNQRGQKEFSIPVHGPMTAVLSLPAVTRTGDVLQVELNVKNNDAPADTYRYVLTATPGLKIGGAAEGVIKIAAAGARKSIAFNLKVLESGEKEIRLDLTGAHGFHAIRRWPLLAIDGGAAVNDAVKLQIAPHQSWSSSGGKSPGGGAHAKTAAARTFYFIGPQPLLDAPAALQALIETEPFTTGEIAAWLETVRLWHDAIINGEFLPAAVLEARQKKNLERLLKRQQLDGGFPVLPGGENDIAATAAALLALAHGDQTLAGPAADAAGGWLSQRLANSWFDEKERAMRAAGFAALATTGRLDVSALRYFAETSDGKSLPPLAAAQLAAALAVSGDQDKARAWLQAARDRPAPALWPVLAANPLFDPQNLAAAMQKFSDDLVRYSPHDPQRLAAFLSTVAIANTRSGGWRAAVDGDEKNHNGVFVTMRPEKPGPLAVRDPMDRPLFVVQGERTTKPPAAAAPASIMRHIYRLDGGEIGGDQLRQGETYLVTLEGPWPSRTNDAEAIFIHDAPASGMDLFGCTLDAAAGSPDMWGWLVNLSLATAASCEGGARGIDAVLARPASGVQGPWRIGYFAEAARAGTFRPPAATARMQASDEWMTSGSQPIVIK